MGPFSKIKNSTRPVKLGFLQHLRNWMLNILTVGVTGAGAVGGIFGVAFIKDTYIGQKLGPAVLTMTGAGVGAIIGGAVGNLIQRLVLKVDKPVRIAVVNDDGTTNMRTFQPEEIREAFSRAKKLGIRLDQESEASARSVDKLKEQLNEANAHKATLSAKVGANETIFLKLGIDPETHENVEELIKMQKKMSKLEDGIEIVEDGIIVDLGNKRVHKEFSALREQLALETEAGDVLAEVTEKKPFEITTNGGGWFDVVHGETGVTLLSKTVRQDTAVETVDELNRMMALGQISENTSMTELKSLAREKAHGAPAVV